VMTNDGMQCEVRCIMLLDKSGKKSKAFKTESTAHLYTKGVRFWMISLVHQTQY
jgi:hypothetical protein